MRIAHKETPKATAMAPPITPPIICLPAQRMMVSYLFVADPEFIPTLLPFLSKSRIVGR